MLFHPPTSSAGKKTRFSHIHFLRPNKLNKSHLTEKLQHRLTLDNKMENTHQIAAPLEQHTSTLVQMPASSFDAADQNTRSYQSPVHQVFDTPELLENILRHLRGVRAGTTTLNPKRLPTCRVLKLCRLVSKTFRNTIDHSVLLQVEMFLKSNGLVLPEGWEDGCQIWRREFITYHDIHPMLFPTFPSDPNPRSDFGVVLRPPNFVVSGYIQNTAYWFNLNRFTQTLENVSGLCEDSHFHKMYITNPPVKKVQIYVWMHTSFNWDRRMTEGTTLTKDPDGEFDLLTNDKGINFGHLFEYAKEVTEGQQKTTLPDPLPTWNTGGGWHPFNNDEEWSGSEL